MQVGTGSWYIKIEDEDFLFRLSNDCEYRHINPSSMIYGETLS